MADPKSVVTELRSLTPAMKLKVAAKLLDEGQLDAAYLLGEMAMAEIGAMRNAKQGGA